VAELFVGYPGTWWVAGGWALQAFTGVERQHGDIDPSVLRSDIQVRRSWLLEGLVMTHPGHPWIGSLQR
jgi:hypothetical protein